MKYIVRPADPEDAAQLRRLNEAFNGPCHTTEEGIRSALASPLSERVFVAEGERDLVGFCCVQVKRSFCYQTVSVELTELYVEPEARRQGVGKALLTFAEHFFSDMPAERFELLTGSDNTAARRFYETLGFLPSGEVHYEK